MATVKEKSKANPNKPSKEVLTKLVNEKGYRYAGEQFGVSDNTARRWMMAYGVELEVKCELKARKRQEYKKVDGKLIYDKDLSPDKQKRAKRVPIPKTPTPKVKVEKVKEVSAVKEQKVKNDNIRVRKEWESEPAPFRLDPAPVVQTQVPAKPVAPAPVNQHPVIDFSKIKNRYSSAELANFETHIKGKIQEVVEDIFILKESLARTTDNGTDDTATSGNAFEDGTGAMERENLTELVAKKQMQLNSLKSALMRVGNGTYGICIVTGNLIPKERLLAVPHTTKCVEAKKDSDNGKVVSPVESPVDAEDTQD